MNQERANEEKIITQSVFSWYKKYRITNSEVEEEFLKEIDAFTDDGKIELLLLARLFSQYMLREEKALKIWKRLKQWFEKEGYSYREIFEIKNIEGFSQFKDILRSEGFPGSAFDLSGNLALAIERLESPNGDIIFSRKESWHQTTQELTNSLRGTGIRQKVFWLFRVLRQTGYWKDIPGEYCCVSDVHVKTFLKKTGFVSDPEVDLFFNSKIIWENFNVPFEEKLYDLAVFRFAREHKCKKCNVTCCNSQIVKECASR